MVVPLVWGHYFLTTDAYGWVGTLNCPGGGALTIVFNPSIGAGNNWGITIMNNNVFTTILNQTCNPIQGVFNGVPVPSGTSCANCASGQTINITVTS
jgi:hypothetical protein